MVMMAEWETVEPAEGGVFPTATDEAVILLNWVYVIERDRFVLRDNWNRQLKEHQFNETYKYLNLPNRLTPARYIRDLNPDTNVVNYIQMAPGKKSIFRDHDGLGVLNLYQGMPIPPQTNRAVTKPTLFLNHLSYIYGSQDKVDHILQWMAHLIYRPEKRINHGLLLSGNHGTGKSTIGRVMAILIGKKHCRAVTPTEFTSNFQDWIVNTRLAVIEEIKEYGRHDSYNKVKPYFTEDEVAVNPKGQTRFQIDNHAHFLLFSNHKYPVPLEPGDRRIYYVHSEAVRQNQEYYDALYAYLDFDGDCGGVWEFGRYLKEEILPQIPDNFATKPPPKTKEHAETIRAAANPIEDYIAQKRSDGEAFYASGLIFHWHKLKDDLRGSISSGSHSGGGFGYILRNAHETASVLDKCNVSREFHVINGKKEDICWFNDDPEFDAKVRRLFKDTTAEGRRELYRLVYRSSLEPSAPFEDDVVPIHSRPSEDDDDIPLAVDPYSKQD